MDRVEAKLEEGKITRKKVQKMRASLTIRGSPFSIRVEVIRVE